MQLKLENIIQPIVIAGPCMAESKGVLDEVASLLVTLSQKLKFTLLFKSSFDKANRSSVHSQRGPGVTQSLDWFAALKSKYKLELLSDVHESAQVAEVAKVVDVLQIPAFLCRQTPLIEAAVLSGRSVNIKKGQFIAPGAAAHIIGKCQEIAKQAMKPCSVMLTERGYSFGYGDLIVDMRGFAQMSSIGVPLIYDVTHSTQTPQTNALGSVTKANRALAPSLARAATATGHLSGYFLEVHPDPKNAKSDQDAQLNFAQAEALLSQLVPFWHTCRKMSEIDGKFEN